MKIKNFDKDCFDDNLAYIQNSLGRIGDILKIMKNWIALYVSFVILKFIFTTVFPLNDIIEKLNSSSSVKTVHKSKVLFTFPSK